MNLSDLSARLRMLATDLQRRGKYDPATDIIAVRESNGIINYNGYLHTHVYDVLLEARNRGAFNSPELVEFRRRIDPTRNNPATAACAAVLDELELRGFNCWGLSAKRGAVERLADAFEVMKTADPTTAERYSDSMSKAEMMNRLKLKQRAFATFCKEHPLKQVGKNRQLFQMRIDRMDSRTRDMILGKKV